MAIDPTMKRLWDSGVDVRWLVGELEGANTPFIAVTCLNPEWAEQCKEGDIKNLQYRYVLDENDFKPSVFLIFDDKDIHVPILSTDIVKEIRWFVDFANAVGAWVLILQWEENGARKHRRYLATLNPDRTTPLCRPGFPDGIEPDWAVTSPTLFPN